ncbi:MAG: DNA integrity scanning diadenylate cyclase DisA [Nanoarchaeota archaeon]|nr:DNA integrity scanning diadenylate cyclase DisA [Nanoarchaeota archaeon]
MSDKKEIQDSLVKADNITTSEEEFFSILKIVAPGTNLRTALDGALSAGKGALIVVENEYLLPIIDGGFRINCKFTPQKLVELTKMDGAIILSKDMKKIDYANILLTPDSRIKTSETGTRHKAAERTAKQIKTLTIAISERRGQITLYYKNIRYPIRDSSELLRKAGEYIQLLEKQRELFDNYVERLNKAEIQNHVNLPLAIVIIQKGMLIQRIAEDLKRYIVELGKEGTLLKIRLKEIKGGVEKETDLVIKDYNQLDLRKSKLFLEGLSYDETLDDQKVTSALGYETHTRTEPVQGWRILSKTSLIEQEAALVINQLGSINEILQADVSKFNMILGQEKASIFKDELEKIRIGN